MYTIPKAHVAVQNLYARSPIASPSAKNSKRASKITSASDTATTAVEPFKIKATTPGINTTAVAIRFQVILVSVLAACAYSASRGTIENSRQQPEYRALCQQSTNVLEVLF